VDLCTWEGESVVDELMQMLGMSLASTIRRGTNRGSMDWSEGSYAG
jgi:hypothetical protein